MLARGLDNARSMPATRTGISENAVMTAAMVVGSIFIVVSSGYRRLVSATVECVSKQAYDPAH